jgi:hypothetical protein
MCGTFPSRPHCPPVGPRPRPRFSTAPPLLQYRSPPIHEVQRSRLWGRTNAEVSVGNLPVTVRVRVRAYVRARLLCYPANACVAATFLQKLLANQRLQPSIGPFYLSFPPFPPLLRTQDMHSL